MSRSRPTAYTPPPAVEYGLVGFAVGEPGAPVGKMIDVVVDLNTWDDRVLFAKQIGDVKAFRQGPSPSVMIFEVWVLNENLHRIKGISWIKKPGELKNSCAGFAIGV
jgi:hypothetical protein